MTFRDITVEAEVVTSFFISLTYPKYLKNINFRLVTRNNDNITTLNVSYFRISLGVSLHFESKIKKLKES